MVDVNFEEPGYDNKKREPLPPGEYHVKVETCEEKTSTAGNDMFNLGMVVLEGEQENRRIWDHLVFAGGALKRVKIAMCAMGYPKDYKGDVTPDMLIGKEVVVTVITESDMYQGEERERNVVTFGGYASAGGDVMDGEEVPF